MERSKLTLRLQVISRALFTGALFYAWLPAEAGDCAPRQISESATVQYVHDGDTVRLKDGRKLRLIGINTPELERDQQPEQALAQQARLKLMALLRQSDYRVMLQFGLEPKDKYQRSLAHIYLPNGTNIQQALLENGLATAYTTPPNAQLSDCYRKAELGARTARLGIWQRPEYQIKPVDSLNRREQGFRIIQGRVSRISSGHKGTNIQLQNKVRLSIRKSDLMYFPGGYIASLQSKTITVRGWLHPQKHQFYMRLRHPDAVNIDIN
ncbi:MAG: thermonuclease family protein [Gammaproteobacteria bacterium]